MKPVIRMMDIPMHPWTMTETVTEIAYRLESNKLTQHAVINVAKFVNMQGDEELRDAVLECDVINIDGMGIVWGGRFLGLDIPERVAGIDLFFELLELAVRRTEPVFFLGSRPEVVEKAVKNLRVRYPRLKIVGWHHGYFWCDEQSVVSKIRKSRATMLFVAITSPKKEKFINCWRDRLGVKFAMGVGGTFDIVAGVTKRAPTWMQRTGLEWLYRVIQEPTRLWKRYVTTNITFLWMLLKAKVRV